MPPSVPPCPPPNPSNPRVFLDIAINGIIAGRIIIELFNDVCPLTCENFRQLCVGIDRMPPICTATNICTARNTANTDTDTTNASASATAGMLASPTTASTCAGTLPTSASTSPCCSSNAALNILLKSPASKTEPLDPSRFIGYRGIPFHAVEEGRMVVGGDVIRGDGSNGISIYGLDNNNNNNNNNKSWGGSYSLPAGCFPDENHVIAQFGAGTVFTVPLPATANNTCNNRGGGEEKDYGRIRNANNSQFGIALSHLPWLDGQCVVFGVVEKGMEVLAKVEQMAAIMRRSTTPNNNNNNSESADGLLAHRPPPFVKIENCGIVQ